MTKIGWPLASNRIRRGSLNHTFGMVRRNRDGSRRPHQGWDFEAPEGQRCFAIADGTIERIRNAGAYGKHVILRFAFDFDDDGEPDTLYAVYCHLSRIDVRSGQKVQRGHQLGLTGNTGNARGMAGVDQHLHFEIRTRPITGRGLAGRFSPMVVFGQCPLGEPVRKAVS
ncbi:M23 family metallopeptidase [Alteriqipengyuania lutimaris]|uniref:M23 family peptidase n=1 Tax=Alteriqipengyuania lutimaris TaxID=1538146 RepID=A0A395LH60_9SPHN|nr:M23 family metallopeptidase [Alteriqipengyuania lutimaris]MBB3035365.1 murein DD-endopeptidase MepM/ murein hydrolase activator NlpD [Alteriqipengyuania lutimaris]RDS75949.1 M23 family peptidase [Alteriqipengyuania lutimaris]